MFRTEKLVFTELHKTGGTHITAILSELLDGEIIGKHNRLTSEEDHLYKIASIRNPWDWYVSLWAYGCQGKGAVYLNTTQKQSLYFYKTQLPNEMGKKRLSIYEARTQLTHNIKKDTNSWKALYKDSNDADLFRKWLKRLLSEEYKFDIGEGYGFSPISTSHGLMTYRMLKLLTHHTTNVYDKKLFDQYKTIRDFWNKNKNTDFIVRNEHLESDLARALELSNYQPMEYYFKTIENKFQQRTNSSKRKTADFYYDQETINLVQCKEQLIIDLFGYTSPTPEVN
ncbi:hypothetical protein [Reinekea marinisedimentorum]|uniref:Sulfotransferase family protein n=1 Tax=Reinekea marinisedimentorum TaxID=230495 RepID=A0A4R3I808_9GAMM|nr:hypothetical protein [Reinekea marinisedimentorum]TCS40297.1 hypothetical protein BCF53_1096 [Reinekea marinisedimentorum]